MRGLLVDLDDTLLDYSGGVEESWAEACRAAACPAGIAADDIIPALRQSRRWFWDDPARHRTERTDMQAAWTKIVAHALESLGRPDPAMAGAVAEAFAAHRWKRMALFPGVVPTLERLRRRGVALALVTNGDKRHQRRKIEDHGLARFFEVTVIEGEFGVGKPDESVYRHALDVLGVPAHEAAMVGDHLEWDVLAPQRLGVAGIWVDALGQGPPADLAAAPHRIIRAFTEIAGEP